METGFGHKRRGFTLAVLCMGVLIAQVDTTVVNLAAHAIGVGLDAPLAAVQWVVDGYNVSYAALLLLGGTLADLFGRRRAFVAGAAIFTAGSIVCGLSPNSAVLIAGRVAAGLGAALLLPSTLSLLRVIWTDPRERAHAIGVWAGTNGIALAIGPTIGGWLIELAGWRSIFLLVVPMGLAVLWLAPRLIPESSDPRGRSIDMPGQALAAFGLAGLATAAIEHGAIAACGAAASVLCLALFLVAERRSGEAAMVPLALLRHRTFSGAIGVAAAMTFGMYGVLFVVPLAWQQSGVLSASWSGLALLPMSLPFVALSHKSGAWTTRFGARAMMGAGMALIASGIAALAVTRAGEPLWLAEAGLFLTGIGMALNTGPVLTVAVAAVESARAGTASALVNTARMVGATLGVAVLGAVYAGGGAHGFGAAMEIGAAIASAGAVLAVLTRAPDPPAG
jgi:EmrB/QacA subfamily drug resistance transporter